MVEDSPPQKNDEQHPLLKVETGGGDSGRPPPSAVTPGWNVACTPKRSWKDRWPELISAFWLSGMFLGIFCLILWGLLGCGVMRRHHILMLHCNNTSRPGSEVYYHHIVQRGAAVPFAQYSEYLSNMASLYTSLHFNVIFLVDDSLATTYRSSRHTRLFKKFMPFQSNFGEYKFDESNQREIKDFHSKYPNVNVTIMALSKFMAMTPLRYKWRTIPMAFLTFYARVFSVWQTGGIGIDLDSFSSQFNLQQLPDKRISAILKQHNNGIKPDEYSNTLNSIEREEQNEFVSLFFNMVHQIINDTRAFFNRTLLYSQDSMEKDKLALEPLIRTHRNKRNLDGNVSNNNSSMEVDNNTQEVNNTTRVTVVETAYKNDQLIMTAEATNQNEPNKRQVSNILQHVANHSQIPQNINGTMMKSLHNNISEVPQIWVLYDFSLFSDNAMGPSYLLPDALMQNNLPAIPTIEQAPASGNNFKRPSYILSINREGTFIAASLKEHPFLAHIISAGCRRLPARFAIQDAIISQCSHMFRDDFYCSNIYLI